MPLIFNKYNKYYKGDRHGQLTVLKQDISNNYVISCNPNDSLHKLYLTNKAAYLINQYSNGCAKNTRGTINSVNQYNISLTDSQLITEQGTNVLISTVSMYHRIRNWNKKNIKNYLEIYIEADIENLINNKKKFFYQTKLKNIVGKNIKAEFPKKPDIIIQNNFDKSISKLKIELIKKIKLKLKL